MMRFHVACKSIKTAAWRRTGLPTASFTRRAHLCSIQCGGSRKYVTRQHTFPASWTLPRLSVRNFSLAADFRGRLLTDEEIALWEEQQALSEKARQVAAQVESIQLSDYTSNFLGDILPDQDDHSTFSIVVAGEFNSGKSTLINGLLGTKLLDTGALPTTDCITILTCGSTNETRHTAGFVLHHVPNVPLLQDLTLVDTPGTNAVLMDHTSRTMKLLPSADLVLFVTSADRPFPDSERELLKSIQAYRKNIVVVLNKMDVLETAGGNYGEDEKQRVLDFVSENASELLGARPIVIPISARDAISAKLTDPESSLWERSNFHTLESFLKKTLTTETKIKAKLTNPIGLAEAMMTQCLMVLEREKEELSVDVATLNLLQNQLQGWEKEMNADMKNFQYEIGSILSNEGERCERLSKRLSLFDQFTSVFDNTRLSAEWAKTKRTSARGVEEELLNIVGEMADSVETRARAQGQAVIEYLGKRPAVKSNSLIGSVTAAVKFDDARESLLSKMSESVKSVLDDYNQETEEEQVVATLQQNALLSSALLLGASATAVATGTGALNVVPGMGCTAALTSLGVAAMTQGNKWVVSQWQEKWEVRRNELDESLDVVSSKAFQTINKKILDSVVPYTRFVRVEKERIETLTKECEDVTIAARALRNRINGLRRY